jgi:aminopeptidase YwaD
MRYLVLSIILTISISLYSQKEGEVCKRFKEDISYLASDQLEGRLTGSMGELKSSMYITDVFKQLNLTPKGDTGSFLQGFDIVRLRLNQSVKAITFTDSAGVYNYVLPGQGLFYPVSQSCNMAVIDNKAVHFAGYGIQAEKLGVSDYADTNGIRGKVFIIKIGSPSAHEPHGKFSPYEDLNYKVDLAIKRGAAGIVFINTDTALANPKGYLDRNVTPRSIPVIFSSDRAKDLMKAKTISFEVKIAQLNSTAHNVIGFIDNKKGSTIVIGAHQDHLGHNEYGGSRDLNHDFIHNGADDNASGVAMLLELARKIKKTKKLRKHNYLFIAFSGEEQGLLGSNYFVKHPTIDTSKISYMLNYDMVGRLDSNRKTLMIYGIGTSPVWNKAISKIKNDTTDLKIKTTESGTGASDHTSFYYSNIPVLHFFTGQHYDYHMPSDDEHLINYHGMFLVYQTSMQIIQSVNKTKSFPFTATKSEESEKMTFKVTMGIMPDYIYDGLGLRVDGVSLEKPAAKAGILKGDIIIQIGEYSISNIQDYMVTLGKFEKGSTTDVKVKRGEETITLKLTF